MARWFVLLGLAWLALVFDRGLAPLVEVRGCAPSACLLAAAASIAFNRSGYGFLAAAWFGLAADLGSSGRLGVSTSCFAVVGYAASRLRASSHAPSGMRQAVELMVCAPAMALSAACVQKLFEGLALPWGSLLGHSLGAGGYTALAAMPFLVLAATANHRSSFAAPAT